MRQLNWTPEQYSIFNEFVGKITDKELSIKMNASYHSVSHKRRQNNIPPKGDEIYTKEHEQFIRDHCTTISLRELVELLTARFPNDKFNKFGIRTVIKRLGLNRTKEQTLEIIKRDKESGFCKKTSQKAAITLTKIKVGDIVKIRCGSGKRMVFIKMEGRKNFKLYHRYLWETHFGEIPKGYYVAIKDNAKDITIDNLQLEKYLKNSGSNELTDNYILGTLLRLKTTEQREAFLNNPDQLIAVEIAQQRLKIEVIREIKSLDNENRKLETPPQHKIGFSHLRIEFYNP